MAELPDFDPYQVLGVDKTSDAGVIKKAYRKLALLKHPDKCGGDEELKKLRTDEFQRLNEAYDIVGDEEKRQRHDALVRLDALRREKASLGKGLPRPFMRASTFTTAYPGTTGTAYTSRGPTNVEDRAPRFFDDDDLYPRRPGAADDYYSRRSAEKSSRAERTRVGDNDREAEEKRRLQKRREREVEERRRESEIRSSRSKKNDYQEERLRSRSWEEEKRRRDDEERARRVQEDPLRKKYSEMEETAQNYTGAKFGGEPRPGVTRRNSTREVPRPYMATRRPRASPKERTHEDTQRELEREKQRLAELKERSKAERAARAQQAERERVEAERQAQRSDAERAAREKEKLDRYERERAKEKERKRREQDLLEQDRLERQERKERERTNKREYPTVRQQKEYVEPYEKRPPVLQHHNSPPFASGESTEHSLPRTRTEPLPSYPQPHPTLGRATTMPVPSNTAARRSAAPPSKLREAAILQDSGYSSSGTAASVPEQRPKTASKSKVQKYAYVVDEEDDALEQSFNRYRSQARDPAPSPMASKWAGLASRGRPFTAHGSENASPELPHAYNSRGAPRAVSPAERAPRRGRVRERERERLYGERRPSYPMTSSYGEPSFSKYDEPIYSGPSSSRRNDVDPYRQPYPYPRTGVVQS